ncbi:LOW QUALITY PROTEIN: pyroglutamyl-peptidase 1-like protein [Neofelis nebulosa]|uniref:LOW QUALITY PROTEIN: pyroglutamyl-peptidase 1-like protein n=1 Tax=Neofelis nebulosa TaxID=61452 RepID=UPI00272AF912|nr:LOW QUALITY PROTEIN: pyroglutamyl-peptidase 1-like protein [Neofelis nebulosa]
MAVVLPGPSKQLGQGPVVSPSPGSKDPKSLKTSGPSVDGSGHLLAGEAGCTLEESLYMSAFPVLRFSRGWFWSPALAQEFRWNPADACQCRPVVNTFMRGGRQGIPEVVPARCGVGAALGPGLVLPRLGPSATSGKAEQASVSLCFRPSLVLLQLVMHIGLDASPKAIVLEQHAKNRGSWDADVRGFRPSRGEGLPDGPEVIASGVSTRALGKLVAVEGAQVLCSRHAGRYVCDYTCYLSLHHGNGRTALVRVPPLSCWLPGRAGRDEKKPELKARFAENSTSVILDPGNRWGGLLL